MILTRSSRVLVSVVFKLFLIQLIIKLGYKGKEKFKKDFVIGNGTVWT